MGRDLKRLPEHRPAQVRLDQDYAFAGEGEGGREVDRRRRLALRRRRAGDQDDLAALSADGGRQGRAQGAVGLADDGGDRARRERQLLGPRLLRDPAEDRQPVEAAQLRLAAQAGVEDLGGEGGDDPQDGPADDAGGDAEHRSRGGLRGRQGGQGLQPHVRGRAACQELQLGDLVGDGFFADCRAAAELPFQHRQLLGDLFVEAFGPDRDRLFGEGVGEFLGGFGRGFGRGHRDDVALGHGHGADLAEQFLGVARRADRLLHRFGDGGVGDEARGGLDVPGRVGGDPDQAEAREHGVVAADRGDQEVRLRFVGLGRRGDVEDGDAGRDEHRQRDQPEPLPDGLDVALQPLLLFGGLQPVCWLAIGPF